MSANAAPISAERFASALPELPLSSLHAKGAEIRNSIAHLTISNDELQEFADRGDADCKEALDENKEVIARMEARLGLLKKEVENRGFNWDEQAKMPVENGEEADGGKTSSSEETGENIEETHPASTAYRRGQGGSLDDAELARRLAEQMEGDNGVHL